MQSTKENIRRAITEYYGDDPNGLDVVAFIFDRIGERDFRKYDVEVPKKTFDQAKQDMGKLVKDLLNEMFAVVEQKGLVDVDYKKWPRLTGWLTSYTQHKVDPTRKKW